MAGLNGIFSSPQFSQVMGYSNYIIYLFFGMIIFGVLAYFVLVMMRYKHKVRILEVVGDALQESNDRGALLKDKQTNKAFQFRLLKNKCVLPPPPANAFIFDKRGKKVLYVAKISPTDYIYVKPDAQDVPLNETDKNFLEGITSRYSYITVSDQLVKKETSLIPIEQDVLFWYINQLEHDNEKYSNKVSWWQNPYVMGIATLAIVMVILIITFKYAGSWQATAKSTALELMNAGKGYVGQVV